MSNKIQEIKLEVSNGVLLQKHEYTRLYDGDRLTVASDTMALVKISDDEQVILGKDHEQFDIPRNITNVEILIYPKKIDRYLPLTNIVLKNSRGKITLYDLELSYGINFSDMGTNDIYSLIGSNPLKAGDCKYIDDELSGFEEKIKAKGDNLAGDIENKHYSVNNSEFMSEDRFDEYMNKLLESVEHEINKIAETADKDNGISKFITIHSLNKANAKDIEEQVIKYASQTNSKIKIEELTVDFKISGSITLSVEESAKLIQNLRKKPTALGDKLEWLKARFADYTNKAVNKYMNGKEVTDFNEQKEDIEKDIEANVNKEVAKYGYVSSVMINQLQFVQNQLVEDSTVIANVKTIENKINKK